MHIQNIVMKHLPSSQHLSIVRLNYFQPLLLFYHTTLIFHRLVKMNKYLQEQQHKIFPCTIIEMHNGQFRLHCKQQRVKITINTVNLPAAVPVMLSEAYNRGKT